MTRLYTYEDINVNQLNLWRSFRRKNFIIAEISFAFPDAFQFLIKLKNELTFSINIFTTWHSSTWQIRPWAISRIVNYDKWRHENLYIPMTSFVDPDTCSDKYRYPNVNTHIRRMREESEKGGTHSLKMHDTADSQLAAL